MRPWEAHPWARLPATVPRSCTPQARVREDADSSAPPCSPRESLLQVSLPQVSLQVPGLLSYQTHGAPASGLSNLESGASTLLFTTSDLPDPGARERH